MAAVYLRVYHVGVLVDVCRKSKVVQEVTVHGAYEIDVFLRCRVKVREQFEVFLGLSLCLCKELEVGACLVVKIGYEFEVGASLLVCLCDCLQIVACLRVHVCHDLLALQPLCRIHEFRVVAQAPEGIHEV